MPSLYNLCKSGSVEEVRAAIDGGEDVNERGGKFNHTCLMVAVYWGHEEMVELLLKRDELDVNARDSYQQTALHGACHRNNPIIVTKLLAHTGLDCNPKSDTGFTPLMCAVTGISRNVETVRLLVDDRRVDLDIMDKKGRTIEEIARSFKCDGEELQLDNILLAISRGCRISRGRLMKEVVSLRRKEAFVTQIAKLQGTHNSSDMTVECQDEKFPCHRAILVARSPTFARGLNSDMIEAINGMWRVKNADPAAVKDMLTFIYSSDIPEECIKERPGELLDLAKQYELPELALACRKSMLKALTTENAVRTLIQLDQPDHDVSAKKADKDEVIEFINKHAKEIVKDTLNVNYPDPVTDILMMALDNQ